MIRSTSFLFAFAALTAAGCSSNSSNSNSSGAGGNSATAGSGGSAGATAVVAGSGGTGGASVGGQSMGGAVVGGGGNAPTTGGGGSPSGGVEGLTPGGTGGGGAAGMTAMAGAGGMAGSGGGGGAANGGTAGAGTGGMMGAGGSVNAIPAGYAGTPFTALTIPGKINTCDYDRGGANVAYGNTGTTFGDQPSGATVYRPPIPANAQICGVAACDDNAGICRMNPSKPDNTINGDPMPADATYLCYTPEGGGEWTKYTVAVTQAGTYSVSCVLASMRSNAGFNISFGDTITTGDVPVTATSTANSGSGENFHSWEDRPNLAMVTFPQAGTYLMTFTQTGRFNASSFTFTKM